MIGTWNVYFCQVMKAREGKLALLWRHGRVDDVRSVDGAHERIIISDQTRNVPVGASTVQLRVQQHAQIPDTTRGLDNVTLHSDGFTRGLKSTCLKNPFPVVSFLPSRPIVSYGIVSPGPFLLSYSGSVFLFLFCIFSFFWCRALD